MVTKQDQPLKEVVNSSVLAKILMVTKLYDDSSFFCLRSVLAKILMVTKLAHSHGTQDICSVLAKILMVTKL